MSSLNLNFTGGMAALQLGSMSSLSTLSENSSFDWNNEDCSMKWKGQFVQPLTKVLYSVHPQFSADQESLEYVESLLVKLLSMITAKPVPSTVSDVEVSIFDFL